jgi:hypothetical protein
VAENSAAVAGVGMFRAKSPIVCTAARKALQPHEDYGARGMFSSVDQSIYVIRELMRFN